MALDDLQGIIKKLQKTIGTHRRYLAENETRTRQVLIDPLLQKLGWDVSNPNIVQLEYRVKQGRPDYALMSNGKPLAVVEAKRLGSDLGYDQIIQALTYAVVGGIPYMILTDGDKWKMYDVLKQATLEERLLMKFRLSEQPAHKNALQTLAMWKPNLTSDSTPSAAIEPVFVSPKAAPDQTDVKSKEQQREQLPNEVSADAEKLYLFTSKQSYPPETTPIRLKRGDNMEKQVKFWQDVTQEVLIWLVEQGKLSGNDCPIKMGEWTFIISEAVNRDSTPFRNLKPLSNGLFWDCGRGTPREQWEILWKLSKQFNIDLSLSEIEVFYKFIGKASR